MAFQAGCCSTLAQHMNYISAVCASANVLLDISSHERVGDWHMRWSVLENRGMSGLALS